MTNNSAKKGMDNKNSNTKKSSFSIKLTEYLACMPGVVMVVMIALMLIMDIIKPTPYDSFIKIFRALDYLIITGGLVLLIIMASKKRLRFCLRDYLFGAFMLCIVISTCINGLSHDSAFGIPYRCVGIFNMFAFFVVYMKVSGYIEKGLLRHMVLLGYLAVADIVALSALYEQYLGDIPGYQGKTGVCAFFGNTNHYGYFLAMAIMIGMGYYIYEVRGKAIFGAVSAIINIYVLVLNNTLGAMLAVGLCTLVVLLLIMIGEIKLKKAISTDFKEEMMSKTAKRALILTIIGAVAVITIIAGSETARLSFTVLFRDIISIFAGNATGVEGSGRWKLWQTVVQCIVEKPLFGYGCEGIAMRIQEIAGISDAHCEPLTYAAYYGIPGALFYLVGVIAAAVRYFKNRKHMPSYCRIAFLGASVYFVSSLVGVTIFYTAPFFFIFMGMAAEELKEV